MRKRWILWLGGALLVYLIGVSISIFVSLNHLPDLFSSPIEQRDSPEFDGGRLGILKPVRHEVDDDWPADIEWAEPEIFPGDHGDFLLEWRNDPELIERPQPDRWTGSLEGDDEIELIAFASWVPQPDDDVSEGADWQATPVFRDAKTLAALDAAELDALGVPESFRRLTPPKEYCAGKLRLLLRAKNMEYIRVTGGEGGDQRTDSVVTYNLDRLGENEPMSVQSGEWCLVDLALLIWHDTPLKLHLYALTGEPEVVELEQRTGAQVAFGDRLRVQWLDRVHDRYGQTSNTGPFKPAASLPKDTWEALEKRINSEDPGMVWLNADAPEPGESDAPTNGLVRVNSTDYLRRHCGWAGQDGEVNWYWDLDGSMDDVNGSLATTSEAVNPDQPLTLVFLPNIAELTFELAGLPDQPNSREIEDLFDIRIPRLTLPEDPDSAEDELIAFLSVGAELAWENSNLWDEETPADFPADRTFRNQSPQELLAWYKGATPGAKIRYDEVTKVIYVNEEKETWWSYFKEWISDLRYYF